MADVREAVESFLADHPDAKDELQELLVIDAEDPPWDFHDIPLDSGRFGEIVSLEIVEKEDGGYRIADREAMRAALSDEADNKSRSTTEEGTESVVTLASLRDQATGWRLRTEDQITPPKWRGFDPPTAGSIGGALLLVALFRLVSIPEVFREGNVVLSGNDPYFYRYLVERMLIQTGGVTDIGALGTLKGSIAKGEPLLVASLWWIAELLGGDPHTAGVVLALYPVVLAVVTGGIMYVIVTIVFRDRRVGVAAIAMLAITPVHAFRTSLGFADHHAFDYPWLALTLLGLVLITNRTGDTEGIISVDRRIWSGCVIVALGVAGQILAWEAGPLLIGAIGVFVGLYVVSVLRVDQSPFIIGLPIVTGLILATVVTHTFHTLAGWHTDQVTYAPLLLAVGVTGIIGLGELYHRLSVPPVGMLISEGVIGVSGWIGFQQVLPEYAARLNSRLAFLFSNRGIVEMENFFTAESGFFLNPLLLFGLVIFLAFPYLIWVSWRSYRAHEPGFLLIGSYAWYFFGLSVIQIRFGGELAPVLAVFAGIGFVHLAARIEIMGSPTVLARSPRAERKTAEQPTLSNLTLPDRSTIFYLGVLFLLIGSLSFVQIPIKTNQLTISDEQYQAAIWIRNDAREHSLSYPESYVLSRWPRNRMYNYFVNGQSKSYAYAQEQYLAFLNGRNGEKWYRQLQDRVGYIVIKRADGENPAQSLYARLFDNHGSRTDNVAGLAHYRVVWMSQDQSLKIVKLVPGATIRGTAVPNTTITMSTTTTVRDQTITYKRSVQTNQTGHYSVVVPYPGTYTIGDQRIRVPPEAISNGTTVKTTTAN